MKDEKLIAVVAARPQRDYNMTILNELDRAFPGPEYRLLSFGSFSDFIRRNRNDAGERSIYQLIPYRLLSGLIILPGSFADVSIPRQIIDTAKQHRLPVISLDCLQEDCVSVVYNYEKAFGSMVRHVLEVHGCRRVCMIAGHKGNQYSEGRVSMFQSILQEKGMALTDNPVFYCDFWGGPAKQAVDTMLASEEGLPEALICANDVMAIAAMEELQKHHIRVPEDVIVTGMDGIPLGIYHSPRLTTLLTDERKACVTAADAMMQMIAGKTVQPVYEIDMRLDLQESCGCRQGTELNAGRLLYEMNEKSNELEAIMSYQLEMKNTLLELNKKQLPRCLAPYLNANSTVCISPSFWELDTNRQKHADWCYDNDGPFFDETLCAAVYRGGNVYADAFERMFDKCSLLPNLKELAADTHQIVFLPLNFQEEVIGYYAVAYYPGYVSLYHVYQMCQHISSVLRVIRDRERADYLYSALESANTFLRETSLHDPLTNLFNRRGLLDHLEEQTRSDSCHALRMLYYSIDVDGLKEINDRWGHLEGDAALRLLAAILSETCRNHPGLVCARVGGDEFVIAGCMEEGLTVPQLKQELEQNRNRVNETSGKEYLIEFSQGFCQRAHFDMDSVYEVIREADEIMYQDKRSRKRLKRRNQ